MKLEILLAPLFVLVLIIGAVGCGGGDDTPVTTPVPTVCQPVTPLFSATEVISDQDHPCREWIHKLQGRVSKNGNMSASVWSLHTETGTGLIVSALHTLGEGYLGPGGSFIEERLRNPNEQPRATRIFLVKDDNATVDKLASVLFILYNPQVPPEQSGNHLRDILPRHDYFVGVIDSQKVVMEPFPSEPAPLKHEAPVIVDPSGLTMVVPTYSDVHPGGSVVLMGYPQTGDYAGMLAASVGSVLSDAEAEGVIKELTVLGDEEGGIDYDPEAEMIIKGQALVGMSGGGVYDLDGKQVGIMVRASEVHDGKQYVRAVRMTFVVDKLMSAYDALSDAERDAVNLYLETTH
ncbi:MAG: trypsin-like peptidase domain-containing protein [Planctomycetes bacterium]|nr:trypsin-like peptidase domain-containing protein [Planctomycetota bacterium]